MEQINTNVGISFQIDPTDDDQLVIPHLISDGKQLAKVDRTPLRTEEKELREECITDIKNRFLELGIIAVRLHTLKAQRLYRETHDSFEQFCEDTFNLSRSHAYRLVSECEVKENFKDVSPKDISTPAGTGQTRTVSGLAKEDQRKVGKRVKELAGDRPATAQDWTKAKQDLIDQGDIQAPAKPKKSKIIKASQQTDAAPKADTVKKVLTLDPNLVSLRLLNQKAKRYDELAGTSKTIMEKVKLWQEIQAGLQAWAVWEEQQLNKEVA